MIGADGLREALEVFGPDDLSVVVALRTAAGRADDSGSLPLDELIEGMQAEYRRLFPSPGTPDGAPDSAGEVSKFPTEPTADYLNQHVMPRLFSEGLLRPGEHQDGDAVQLGPRFLQLGGLDREYAISALDERLAHVLPVRTASESQRKSAASGLTLRAEGLVKVYRKRRVVDNVAVQVTEGEIVGMLGPNGAGKTTTFYMMVGLIAPDAGRVLLGKDDVTKVPMYRRARRGIGYLAQEPSIFRRLTVEENILAILQMLRVPRSEREERLERYLDELNIKRLRHTRAYALSGGERRRLEITRALVSEPKFMLLDEPFAGVDPIAVHDIQGIVADLRRRGIGVLISDHNVEQTLDIVDRAYIMYEGQVAVSGTVSELVWNEEVAEIYLGPTLTARMRTRYPRPA